MGRKAVVLHSGGLDSTVCLLKALEQGIEAISLGIDYAQRHAIELEYARRHCARFDIPRRVITVRWDKPDRELPRDRSVEDIRSGVSSAFLPGRNAVFLTLACAEAAGLGADEVWIGVNSVDYSGYPDCRPEFVESFRRMIREAVPDGPEIVTPLLMMSKPEIAREARRLGINKGDTWSCYRPVEAAPNRIEPCGRCDACILHDCAWKETLKKTSRAGSCG